MSAIDKATILFAVVTLLFLFAMPAQGAAPGPVCRQRIEYRRMPSREHCRPGSWRCYPVLVTVCK